jgi:hypothetical protein
MGNVLDLAEVVAQDVDHVAPAHAALAASWFSLVNTVTHNSAESLTDWIKTGGGTEKDYCPDARVVEGRCRHREQRVVVKPCKRRGCPYCGPKGRQRIAERIANGVRVLWPCAWLVLTFETADAEDPDYKAKATRRLASFIRWLRQRMPDLEYAATYELQKRGRLHINLIAGPWTWIDQAELQRKWGARLSVELVRESEAIGAEAAKTYSPESLGKYLSKLDQAVPEEWGRRCSFSKGWPKLPPPPERKGHIAWRTDWQLDRAERNGLWLDYEIGLLEVVRPGELVNLRNQAGCDCFDFKESFPAPPG